MSLDYIDYMITYDKSVIKEYCHKQLKLSEVDLHKLITKAKELTIAEASLKPKNYKQRNYMAEIMYGNMIGLAYENYGKLIHQDNVRCHYFLLSKNLRIYLKKLDNNLPNNVLTDAVIKRRGELMLNDERIHALYAGYNLDDNDWAKEFKNVSATYMNIYNPRKMEWALDLKDYIKQNSIIKAFNDTVADEENLVKVSEIAVKKSAQ